MNGRPLGRCTAVAGGRTIPGAPADAGPEQPAARPRGHGLLAGQAVRFAAIGVVSTLAYLLLFVLARPFLGAQASNLIALLVTAIANTAANRRFTFGVRGGDGAARHQLQGLVVFGLGLGLTSGALWLLAQVSSRPPRVAELAVLITANLLATVLRFVLLRVWVFRSKESAS
jgi:putative flippase GtrA